ncbi:hypothetical protein ATC00_04215 [Sinorhizobium americanum]|nr:hypothetical protein ATC00_04215 [Sinorhizobium americanum]
MICLAAVVYYWNIAAIFIIAWWVGALIGLLVERSDPSHGKSSTSQIINTESLGLLSIWRGVWNGFYVWKDLDHDFHRRNRE